MTFNDRLKYILAFKKISQKKFASEVNMSESQLSKLLNSKKKPTTKELDNIIKVLNIPYDCAVGKVPLFDELLLSKAKAMTTTVLW